MGRTKTRIRRATTLLVRVVAFASDVETGAIPFDRLP